jgi:NitT/TauT family transport system permease protein
MARFRRRLWRQELAPIVARPPLTQSPSGFSMQDVPALSAQAALELGSPPSREARWRVVARTAYPFLVVGAIWEIVARSGIFPARLFPTLEEIAATFVRLSADGILPHHALDTIVRLLVGFGLAALLGVAIGIAMGRSRRAEDVLLPLVSIGAPIPGIAYAPLFLLWFGLGNFSTVLLVAFVSAFPIIFNTWSGVKAVREIWVRSAQAMGADDRRLFRHVILPGALPYILTGLRLGLAQAWRILVGVEMLAAVPWGLGWLIFGAREFLNIDVMLAGVAVIGIIGLALEKLVFQRLENFTVVRWGMMT